MLRWFNHNQNRIFLVLSVAWALLFCAHLWTAEYDVSLFSFFVPYLLFTLVYVYAAALLKVGELNRGVGAYQNSCDPQAMLDLCDLQLSDLSPRGRDRAYGQTLRANRVAALLSMGRLDEAEQALDALFPCLPQKLTPAVLVCRAHRIGLLLSRRQVVGVEEALDETGALAQRVGNALLQRQTAWLLEEYRCALLLLQGQFRGPAVDGRLLALADTAPNRAARVTAAFLLGWFYQRTGQEAAALPHLQYAAENGGALAVRENAQALLTSMTRSAP